MIPGDRRSIRLVALLLSLPLAAMATGPRVRALGDGAAYFEDDTAPATWFGALVDYPDLVVLDLGEFDHDGGGSFNERTRGSGGTATLAVGEGGRAGVIGVMVQEDLPVGAPGGAIHLGAARSFGRLSVGGHAMLTSHFDGENSTETYGDGESLYFHSYGLGARWDASDRLYGDLAAEIVNTKADASEEGLWAMPASSVWTSWAARARAFWAVTDRVVLVPAFDYRSDDRRVVSAEVGAPSAQDAWQSSAGLGVNVLRDPDNLLIASAEWRWGTEEHQRLPELSSSWDYDAFDLDYHEIHVRAGIEARALPWLSLRGSLQYLRLQHERQWTRGGTTLLDPDRWAEKSDIEVRTPVTLGAALHAGRFQADVVFNGHWSEAPGTVPFGARPATTDTYSGVAVRYLF